MKEAAVIAVKSKRWMERPMACVVFNENETMTAEELNEFLAPKMAKVRRDRRGMPLHMYVCLCGCVPTYFLFL